MPATRRSSRAAAAKKIGRQSTLSFNNRVSKPGAAKASAKEPADAVTPPPSSLAKKAVAVEPVAQEGDEDEEGKYEQPETLDEDADEGRITTAVQAEQRPAVEVKAERVTDAQIKRYWRDVEDARVAKRVHQEDLSLAEKVLRYFDISSQYGVRSHLLSLTFSFPRPLLCCR